MIFVVTIEISKLFCFLLYIHIRTNLIFTSIGVS